MMEITEKKERGKASRKKWRVERKKEREREIKSAE